MICRLHTFLYAFIIVLSAFLQRIFDFPSFPNLFWSCFIFSFLHLSNNHFAVFDFSCARKVSGQNREIEQYKNRKRNPKTPKRKSTFLLFYFSNLISELLYFSTFPISYRNFFDFSTFRLRYRNFSAFYFSDFVQELIYFVAFPKSRRVSGQTRKKTGQ